MNLSNLEKTLMDSLEDFRLDQQEKIIFRDLSEELRDDQLRFIRNKAFDLAQPHVEKGGTDAIRVLNWLNNIVKTVQSPEKKNIADSLAYFSPGSDCRNKIIALMNAARKSVKICVFTISDNKITQSILAAHQRGVEVAIISDNDKSNDKGSDVNYLFEKGVNVILDNSPYHMHHKFAIFDNRVLLNGSFNWTRSATDVNEENILVTEESKLVSQFSRQFDYLIKNVAL